MPVTLNEKLIAYLALFSGLAISLVAEFYSIIGFTAIFAAAQIPVIIMGVVLGVGKIAATLWLKQNWKIAHWLVRTYLLTAIAVLMGVTSMGIFGFLSKAHSDQSLVSGDVQSKIAVYDEKIKTAKDNIDANRKALNQMDEAVDQVMGRSQDEKGADKAVGLRRAQQKERARLQSEIQAEQKTIAGLTEERAPIAADIRKIEAEVGPIKYIAQFVYGESDKDLLEKAVTWVIIILIAVFDPLAVILLLSSQISFQNFRERTKEINWQERTEELLEIFDEEPTKEEPVEEDLSYLDNITESLKGMGKIGKQEPVKVQWNDFDPIETTEGDSPEKESDVVSTATVTTSTTITIGNITVEEEEAWADLERRNSITEISPPVSPKPVDDRSSLQKTYDAVAAKLALEDLSRDSYVQNEEQKESNVWSKTIDQKEYVSRSQLKLENHIDEIVELVKTNQITFDEVPRYIQNEVKAKL
jgi:hypothetical protein